MKRATVLALAAVFLLAPLAAQDPESKLDRGLNTDRENPIEVFVRMQDQILKDGKAWPGFCKQHAKAKRRELRTKIVADLKQRANKSFQMVAEKVKELQKSGDLKGLNRYWLVNGFACRATGSAIGELAKLKEVEFIYRKHPRLPSLAKGGPRGRVPAVRRQQNPKAALKKALAVWKKAKDESFDPKGLTVPWNLKRIGADKAWAKGVTGKGVVIAVLDSGIVQAESLVKALWRNPKEEVNGKDDDGNGYVDDLFGWDFVMNDGNPLKDPSLICHGTICAGIMVGRPVKTDDGVIITGIAPDARVMALRGMGLLKAYEYAVENGADIMSMSYMWVGIPIGNYRGVYRLAHEHAAAAGLVAVGGSGNFGGGRFPEGKQICLPKDIPCVIAAGGINKAGKLTRASSRGPCMWDDVKFYEDYPADAPLQKPDVTGCFGGYPCWVRIHPRMERIRWTIVHEDEDGYGLVVGPQGNSFSGPHAGAVAALMLSVNMDLPSWKVMELMVESCKDMGKKGHDTRFGAGLLQADAAVEAVRKVK